MSGSHPTDKLLNIITHSPAHGSPNSSIVRSSEICEKRGSSRLHIGV
nr:MAG TPA: hypothetical protein [Caudoviricetes sp.]